MQVGDKYYISHLPAYRLGSEIIIHVIVTEIVDDKRVKVDSESQKDAIVWREYLKEYKK